MHWLHFSPKKEIRSSDHRLCDTGIKLSALKVFFIYFTYRSINHETSSLTLPNNTKINPCFIFTRGTHHAIATEISCCAMSHTTSNSPCVACSYILHCEQFKLKHQVESHVSSFHVQRHSRLLVITGLSKRFFNGLPLVPRNSHVNKQRTDFIPGRHFDLSAHVHSATECPL